MKHIKLWKKMLIALSLVVILGVIAMLTYRVIKTQGVVEDYIVNSEVDSPCLVIATQKSEFKGEVLQQVVEKLGQQKIRIHVTDVTRLEKLNDSQWDGMIIFTTVESGQIQKDSYNFLKNHSENYARIGLVYTADSNTWKNKDIEIDAVSSASQKNNVGPVVQKILEKSEGVMNK